MLSNLALIQDDDGTIAEDTVDEAALTPEVRDKLNDTGAGGGGSVNSVNGKQGDVQLTTENIPATQQAFYYNVTDQEKLATVESSAQKNRQLADQDEAEAGTDNVEGMTALRTKQAIDAQVNAVPDFTAQQRVLPAAPVFDANVTYDDVVMVADLNVNYGVPDVSWINGAAQIVAITGDGSDLIFAAEYLDLDTSLNANIPLPANAEEITYTMRWLQDSGTVLVGTRRQYIRSDGIVPMEANLDMDGFDILTVGAIQAAQAILSVPQPLVYQASIQLSLAASNSQIVGALTGNLTLSNPINDDAGRSGIVYLDNRGGHVVTMGANWKILDGQSTVFASKEVLVTYFVPVAGTISYSIRELN